MRNSRARARSLAAVVERRRSRGDGARPLLALLRARELGERAGAPSAARRYKSSVVVIVAKTGFFLSFFHSFILSFVHSFILLSFILLSFILSFILSLVHSFCLSLTCPARPCRPHGLDAHGERGGACARRKDGKTKERTTALVCLRTVKDGTDGPRRDIARSGPGRSSGRACGASS